jgi:glucuronate isomerase
VLFHPDTLFPPDPAVRGLARALHAQVAGLPLVCPHGHCDAAWFATDQPFENPVALLVQPDHYLLRMLISQGLTYEQLGIGPQGAGADPRQVWRRFVGHWHLFAGTPSRLWLDYTFSNLFGLTAPLTPATAEVAYEQIAACLALPEFRPRALFQRFNIAVLATTDSALDDLGHHRAIRASGWAGRIIPTYRPDSVTDPEAPGFAEALDRLGDVSGEDTGHYGGYLAAHRQRRAAFRDLGATATDHGVPDARTADLSHAEAAALFDRIRRGRGSPDDAAQFRAQMLTEMARMSVDDGMVMQIHPGSLRNHSHDVRAAYGPDRGFDIPVAAEFTRALQPLLNAVGHAPGLRIILFTLDEATYARELAPLAGAWPCLRLGPPWWFHDSPEGMRRYRERVTETAGFWNTAGFNDDTRAFPSIPARHDIARRADCAFLAGLVADHRLREEEAADLARLLAGDLARDCYRLVQ